MATSKYRNWCRSYFFMKEPTAAYGRHFGVKKGVLSGENSYFYNVRRYYSRDWRGPTPILQLIRFG